MDPLNRRLQEAFLFTNADLRANRAGQLSVRQQARLRSARSSQWLALMVFIIVMIGSVAVIAFAALISRSNTNPNPTGGLLPMAIIAGVVGGVILIGALISRPYLTGATPRRMILATGPAQPGRMDPSASYYEVKIGAAALRLAGEAQLAAFEPGVAYRIFYLPGPVATVLSGQVIGSEAEAEDAAEKPLDADPDVVVQMQTRARPVLIVLGVLALGIPVLVIAASVLPGALRALVIAAGLLLAVGFVFWALRRLSR